MEERRETSVPAGQDKEPIKENCVVRSREIEIGNKKIK